MGLIGDFLVCDFSSRGTEYGEKKLFDRMNRIKHTIIPKSDKFLDISEEKVECSKCSRNRRDYGCFRAWVKGGPANCIDFEKRKRQKWPF